MPSTTGGGARRAFVAGTGFEPVASWLWARRGTKLLQPAVTCHSDAHCVPPERFELPIIGLKVRCVDRCATRGGVLSLRIELSFRLLIRQLRPPCRPKRKQVGHLGVEPSYTALSERPLRPDGPWPMNRGCSKPAAASAAHRASASNGARRPGRFTFHEYRPGDSNPDHPRPERGASAIGLGRHASG